MSVNSQTSVQANITKTPDPLDHIQFTPREIEVLSCLIGGRSPKKIAVLLGITPKTVGTHFCNVMNKVDLHAREQVLELLAQSQIYPVLQKHYLRLVVKAEQDAHFRYIARTHQKKIVYMAENANQDVVKNMIEKLGIAGVTVKIKPQASLESKDCFLSFDGQKHFIIEQGGQKTCVLSEDIFSIFDVLNAIFQSEKLDHLIMRLKKHWPSVPSAYHDCKTNIHSCKTVLQKHLGVFFTNPKYRKPLISTLATLLVGVGLGLYYWSR